MFEEKLLARMILIENQRDAVISRLPRIAEQFATRPFKVCDIFVTQQIQSLTQRRAPSLIPSLFAAGVTAAIANPAANAMRTTPRGTLSIGAVIDFNLE